MATAAASLQPSKPMVPPPINGTSTHDGSTSQTPLPASVSQRGELQGFGVLQHTGPPVQDDIPGLYRDGRVRNPVPNKLKGKTDAKKGNFGVMHIDLTTTNETQERDAAAKRTSESTQLAAKLAQTDRYVPIKRSKFVYRPDGELASSSPQPTSLDRTPTHTAAEIKAEQARLLTLLRSLHPVLVVDQLCKALAFFGGIPGAQASTDGTFPDSAEANGSGSLFIAWLAEIFPALDPESMANVSQATIKRPRGRPKGSKNAKGKKYKTFNKRLDLDSRLASASERSDVGDGRSMNSFVDDSWVDIDGAVDNEEGNTVELTEEGAGRMAANSHGNSRSTAGAEVPGGGPGGGDPSFTIAKSTLRRRGRPKGSKNRPKGTSLAGVGQKGAGDVGSAVVTGSSGLALSTKKRKPGPGRPKGSKNRPKEPKESEATGTSESSPLPAPTVQQGERTGEARGSGTFESGTQTSLAMTATAHAALPHSPRQESTLIMPRPVTPQASDDIGTVKSNAGTSKNVKRKRTSSVMTKTSRSVEFPLQNNLPPVQLIADGTSQVIRRVESPVAFGPPAQQLSKKRKLLKELPQNAALNSKTDQSIGNSAVLTDPVGLQVSQPTLSTGDYGAAAVRVDNQSNMRSVRNQLTVSMSCSPHQQKINSQNSVSDLQVDYNQNPHDPGSNSKSLTTGPYPMTLSGRPSQSLYSHTVQTHYGQQTQRQQQQQQQDVQQQVHSRSHSYPEQRLMNSSASQLPSAGQNASDSDGGYQGLISHQPSFRAQATISTSPDSNYRTPASRSVQNQSPAFQSRQVHHTPTSNMSSFQEYTDSPFLDMTDLESASQGNLPIGHSSYGLTSGNMQRSSSTVNASYNSTTDMGHSFDGSMTESALRERMYHTLRRQ
ncbi:uncharacterized protein CTRU02_206031 [Colletotrichum truncatum]|uniref:Uncharacterized protein n=1 Tax=Colletotrichum truncatum TaxID=5467 RepID=A0ACC3Z5P8_COLTU|nr:uncharacterized protein CTRU02_04865 [Colletotrichum truncatum]KAF6795303.1 hypothetical protein CTRU02_04865 [Colletotrichum truncatum]